MSLNAMRTTVSLLCLSALLPITSSAVAAKETRSRKPLMLFNDTTPKSSKNSKQSLLPPGVAAMAPSPVGAASISVDKITSITQFDELSTHGQGVIKSDVIKFLIDNRGAKPRVYFINGNFGAPQVPDYVKYHYYFAQKQLHISDDIDSFNNMTYFTNDLQKKKFIAGTLQKYDIGTAEKPNSFYGIQFYPQDQISEASILFAVSQVQKVVGIAGARLAFVSYGTQQSITTVKDQLSSLGIEVNSLSDIYSAVPYMAMNAGEAWGYLRVHPQADALTNKDIPLFDELPLNLSVVAAAITTVIQDSGSHINLKSKERGTPDMVLRDTAKIQSLIQDYQDKPIHLTVSENGYSIQASTDEEVNAHHKPSTRAWVDFKVSKDHTLRTYDEMANVATAAKTLPNGMIYGGKASKNGFLAHRQIVGEGSAIQKSMGYRLTVLGFGIPMAFYKDFVDANPALKAKIQELIDSEINVEGHNPLPPAEKIKLIDEIQSLFYSGQMPAPLMVELQKKMDQFKQDFARVYPKTELKAVKIRSSANSEDVDDFDGAGLHDSFSASLKKGLGDPQGPCERLESTNDVETKQEMSPDNVVCAIKGVYASLWNRRAVEERSSARINHNTAAMGIAVNQKYDSRKKTENITEVANAVVVTRILAGSGVYGYQLSLNTADNLVTNPTPGTRSEMVLATFLGDEKPEYSVTQFAITGKGQPARTSSIVSRDVYDRLVRIAQAVELGYCKAIPGYYGNDCSYVTSDPEKPKSLDMEFKIFSNGEVLIKQTREFSGR